MRINLRKKERIRTVMGDIWRGRFHWSIAKLSWIIFNPREHPQRYTSMRHRDLRNATLFYNNYIGPALMNLISYGNKA